MYTVCYPNLTSADIPVYEYTQSIIYVKHTPQTHLHHKSYQQTFALETVLVSMSSFLFSRHKTSLRKMVETRRCIDVLDRDALLRGKISQTYVF